MFSIVQVLKVLDQFYEVHGSIDDTSTPSNWLLYAPQPGLVSLNSRAEI